MQLCHCSTILSSDGVACVSAWFQPSPSQASTCQPSFEPTLSHLLSFAFHHLEQLDLASIHPRVLLGCCHHREVTCRRKCWCCC